jgi:ComF family protein
MKASSAEPVAEAMGELLCQRRGDYIRALRPNLIVPVPMHWRRRWVRKMNSPDILADRIGRLLQVPCRDRLLRLNRNIKPQKGLSRCDRRKNMVGAFRLARGYDIKGARVLLVDDVLTTGATCDEAAKTLKGAGAASVVVTVLARTVGESDV